MLFSLRFEGDVCVHADDLASCFYGTLAGTGVGFDRAAGLDGVGQGAQGTDQLLVAAEVVHLFALALGAQGSGVAESGEVARDHGDVLGNLACDLADRLRTAATGGEIGEDRHAAGVTDGAEEIGAGEVGGSATGLRWCGASAHYTCSIVQLCKYARKKMRSYTT